MVVAWGKAAYEIYRAVSRAIAPLLYLHLHWRRLRGLEHRSRWPERFGCPSAPRPRGRLIWFHAVSLGEGLAAIPVIKSCLQENPNMLILMTTTTLSAFEVIQVRLPRSVIHQFAPLDTPMAIKNFLVYWDPFAVILMESELWPNLIISASEKGVKLALLNARISYKSFRRWSMKISLPLISLMLSKFSLIVPLSMVEAIRFQLLNAPPFIISFSGDLKYAVGGIQLSERVNKNISDFKLQLIDRPVWMAASIHRGEEEVMVFVHKELTSEFPNLFSILVTRHPQHGRKLAQELQRRGLNVALRSRSELISPCMDIYIVDTLGDLGMLYKATPIAVIGGSFLHDLAGHNFSEAAAAGCAVLTGPYIGHFSSMLAEMQRVDSLSILQVEGKVELVRALKLLLSNSKLLAAHQKAAKHAFSVVSKGVVRIAWDLINTNVCKARSLNY
ncbi:putative 3-deoxy-D-manno-octulosonic acid transferase, mitochondrial [Apostasia shenzhenica]|uniref:lipid IVA 3-deoxy-D-manno-octulosonic acid transferase n=1 Tax=Apostasia shenzhenica TaxID=1088818 RepID=A0A2H9ZX55_9ASPA|nr:putative 3-deoxy-D-manno-octulosonic acid transferase, mitochondrial [Apostasia shenzhenica]